MGLRSHDRLTTVEVPRNETLPALYGAAIARRIQFTKVRFRSAAPDRDAALMEAARTWMEAAEKFLRVVNDAADKAMTSLDMSKEPAHIRQVALTVSSITGLTKEDHARLSSIARLLTRPDLN